MFVLVGVASATAQEAVPPYRQTVVVTAATTPVELGSVTRTLTVITRRQIEVLPVQSIADVLRLVSSVDVRARGIRGVQTDFAVRGANFGQMLMLVDGVHEIAEADVLPYTDALHRMTEAFSSEGVYGQYGQYLLMVAPFLWWLVAIFWRHGKASAGGVAHLER